MKWINFTILFFFFGCTSPEQKTIEPTKIILDTDMGSDCDDVGALALLNEYSNNGKVEILGVIYSSGIIPYGVGVIDAINKYYGNNNIPIGANHDKIIGDTIDKMQAEKLAKDTTAFKNEFISSKDVTEQTELIRNLIAGQKDNSVVYITIGHTKGLYDLLTSKPDSISHLSGYELTKKKIKKWVALGGLNASNKEGHLVKDWNFYYNGTASYTKYLINNFPNAIYFIDGGKNVMTGKSLINTPPGNIVRTAYQYWLWNIEKKPLKAQRPSWDIATVYFAVENSKKYFNILPNGYLDFDIDKGCRWIEKDTISNQYFVIQKNGTDNELANYFNEMLKKHTIKKHSLKK